jgi:hypothetical protein
MSVFTEVLAIEVGMRGIDVVTRGFESIAASAKVSESEIKQAAVGFAQLGVVAGVAMASVREYMGDEKYKVVLQSLISDTGRLKAVMESVHSIAAQGVFNEDEVWKAATAFEAAGQHANDWLKVTEALAAHGGGGAGAFETASDIIRRVQGGDTMRTRRALEQLNITPMMMRSVGVTNIDKATKDQLLAAFKRLGQDTTIQRALSSTFGAQWGALIYQFTEGLKSMGASLTTVLSPVISIATKLMSVLRTINEITRGWAGNIIMAVVAFNGVLKIIPALVSLLGIMKDLVKWQTIYNTLSTNWGKIVEWTGKAVGWMRQMLTIEKILAAWETFRAMLAAAFAAAYGNLVPLGIIAAAGVATAGLVWGMNKAFGGDAKRTASVDPKPKPAALKRSDWENFTWDRMGKQLG